mmetsp:Transcript_10837/g.31534  ORF Transcript_10837/g.31534 Transcript_10837/m.31534 type:complete len:126 (+) Transcript_10837:159-536(+)
MPGYAQISVTYWIGQQEAPGKKGRAGKTQNQQCGQIKSDLPKSKATGKAATEVVSPRPEHYRCSKADNDSDIYSDRATLLDATSKEYGLAVSLLDRNTQPSPMLSNIKTDQHQCDFINRDEGIGG